MSAGVLALWCSLAAWAADVPLVEQRQLVDRLAAQVAAARAGSADRDELGRLMAEYREEAERLAVLEGPALAAAADATARDRLTARRDLADALATGAQADRARAALVAWLGEPSSRLPVLEAALTAIRGASDDGVRRGSAADVADQADVLALVSSYDLGRAERDHDRAALQAAALRARTAPGRTGGMDLVVAAERLEREAADAREQAIAAGEALALANGIRTSALALYRETP